MHGLTKEVSAESECYQPRKISCFHPLQDPGGSKIRACCVLQKAWKHKSEKGSDAGGRLHARILWLVALLENDEEMPADERRWHQQSCTETGVSERKKKRLP